MERQNLQVNEGIKTTAMIGTAIIEALRTWNFYRTHHIDTICNKTQKDGIKGRPIKSNRVVPADARHSKNTV